MQIWEHGQENRKTLLFLPCTAEPVWAFSESVALLARQWHVFQVIYDGHQPEYLGDFTSVEQTVDDVLRYLNSHGVTRLDAAYACLLRDDYGFKLIAKRRDVLEAMYPPARFTLPGHDPVKEYDAIAAYLQTYSDRTIRNIFWSGNNYTLPRIPAKIATKITYWYGDDEKKDRRANIRFIKRYFPQARIHGIPKMAHAELVMVHPEEFCRYAEKFLVNVMEGESQNG